MSRSKKGNSFLRLLFRQDIHEPNSCQRTTNVKFGPGLESPWEDHTPLTWPGFAHFLFPVCKSEAKSKAPPAVGDHSKSKAPPAVGDHSKRHSARVGEMANVGKPPAALSWGLRFDAQHPCKSEVLWHTSVTIHREEGAEEGFPEFSPSQSSPLVSPRLNKKPTSTNKKQGTIEKAIWPLGSGLWRCACSQVRLSA